MIENTFIRRFPVSAPKRRGFGVAHDQKSVVHDAKSVALHAFTTNLLKKRCVFTL
jgi:hypothetical protein